MKLSEFETEIKNILGSDEPSPDRYFEPSRATRLRMLAGEIRQIAWQPGFREEAQALAGKALLCADLLG